MKSRWSLLAAAALTAFALAASPPRPTPAARRRSEPRHDSALARETAEHNVAVEARKAEKRERKLKRNSRCA